MIKKEFIASIGIAMISVVFVTVSLLLYFDKNNKWLVARKIKLGATMLTLTAFITACSGGTTTDDIEIISCYEPTVIEDTLFDDIEKGYIEEIDTNHSENTVEEVSVGLDSIGKISMPDNAMCYGAPASWDDSTQY